MGNMETLKTGTTTIGMKFKDGVLIAADKRATAGNLIVDKKAHKVHISHLQ
jgi:proteasome beta subunit